MIKFAMETVRLEISSRSAAAMANALLLDLKEGNLIKEDVNMETILFDKRKLDRAKTRVRVMSSGSKEINKYNLECIGVDGRVDTETKCFEEVNLDGFTKTKQCVKKEHHLTYTAESGLESGEYLTHIILPLEGSTGSVMADESYKVLEKYKSLSTLKALLVDNTASNTGYQNGLVVCLERLISRTLHTVPCMLHWNECPWKAIFKTKDGITAGPKTFTGTIGKQAAKDLHNTPVANFEIITSNLIELPSDVLKQLSHDQRLLHEYTIGISSGTIDKVYASRTIGPLNHARWLTLALRVMCVYARTVKPSIKL